MEVTACSLRDVKDVENKYRQKSTRLHGVTPQTIIFIVTAVRASNLRKFHVPNQTAGYMF
jgi:hypothetical protein